MAAASAPARARHWLILGLLAAIALDTGGQLLWKLAASRLPVDAAAAELAASALRDPLAWVVVGVFLAQLVNWLAVLKRADLSYAQPFTALSYVGVGLLSALWFGESLGAAKLAGIALVLVGVVLVGFGASEAPAPSTPAEPSP